MKTKLFITVMTAALLLGSCATAGFMGPRNYVEFASGKQVKRSEQMTLDQNKKELASAYEDEFTYDDNGNMIKHKQTEVFDRYTSEPKYVVWETEWKVIAGKSVPYQASVNGTVYATIEYEILNIENEGGIYKDVVKAFYYEIIPATLFTPVYTTLRDTSLNSFPVPFPTDDEFVVSYSSYRYYYGFEKKNVLVPGFNNIVLKSYNLSWSDMLEGMSKSFKYGSRRSSKMSELAEGQNVDFQFVWETIAGSAYPVKISHIVKTDARVISNMEVIMKYDASGNRTDEEWVVLDHSKKEPERVTVFRQSLEY